MDSSRPHKSPHNIQISHLQNTGDPRLPCPHPGCVLSFTTPNGLRRHSRTGKHKFSSNAQPPPSPAHPLQRYKPQFVVETLGKTPRIPKVSSFNKPATLPSSQTSQNTTSTSTTSSSSSSFSESSSSESLPSTSTSSSSSFTSGTHTLDERVDSPPVSRVNTPYAEDDILGRDKLQEDMEDDDGVPVSRVYHPLLDGKFNLSLSPPIF
jgi:hypothetical protein